MYIWEAQKHADPMDLDLNTDLDLEHWYQEHLHSFSHGEHCFL